MFTANNSRINYGPQRWVELRFIFHMVKTWKLSSLICVSGNPIGRRKIILNFLVNLTISQQSYEDEDYHVDSFPKDFGYGAFDQDGLDLEPNASSNSETKPRILLMGLRRSGKSSIQKVVFHKMSPNETLFLESTSKIVKDDINNSSFVQFQIWDFPGQIDFIEPTFDSDMIFGGCGALVFVIDAKDDYNEALTKFKNTVIKAYKVNPRIKFEVFIHKVRTYR